MSGQCYGCGTSYTVFKKEHGCKNCRFSFCARCVKQKAVVPKLGKEKHSVCNKCFDILNGLVKPEDNTKYSPPDAFKKRLSALNQPTGKQAPGEASLLSSRHGQIPKEQRNLAKPDREIADRLAKLDAQQPKVTVPTTSDMYTRLAKLKGVQPDEHESQPKKFYHAPDPRTQQEEINDLLNEISDEVVIDNRPISEVQHRLDNLNAADTPSDANNLNKDHMSPVNKISSSTKDMPLNIQPDTIQVGASTQPNTTNDGTSTQQKEISFQEIQDMMSKAAAECSLDAQRELDGLAQDKEIMERLAEVKKRMKQGDKQDNDEADAVSRDSNLSEDEETDEQYAQRLTKQYLAESQLDEEASKDGITLPQKSQNKTKHSDLTSNEEKIQNDKKNEADSDDDPDELPWCVICNENAVLRCYGCDRDLYCNRCFKEGHDKLGLDDHVTVKYIRPRSLKNL